MKTSFAQNSTIVQREGGMACCQSKDRKIRSDSSGFCEHEFVTELCILMGCKHIGVRLLEKKQTGDRAEKRAANAPGVTHEERASLAGS